MAGNPQNSLLFSLLSGNSMTPIGAFCALAPPHFRVCLKYLKSGGAWFFLAGISIPSPLRK